MILRTICASVFKLYFLVGVTMTTSTECIIQNIMNYTKVVIEAPSSLNSTNPFQNLKEKSDYRKCYQYSISLV